MKQHHHTTGEGGGLHLHLLVQDGARELCRVAMPPRAVDNLPDLFPDEDRAKMADMGVDLPAIATRVASSGYTPQVVLEADSGARQYRIWIG